MNNEKQTIVVFLYPCCGNQLKNKKEYDLLGYKVLEVDTSSFFVEKRKRTAEELEAIKNRWDEEGHLLSGDGYINRIKDDMTYFFCPDCKSNVVNYIRDNIGKHDFIFVNDNKEIIRLLHKEGIKVCRIYPDSSLLETYVGKMFLNGDANFLIKKRIESWEEDTSWNSDIDAGFILRAGEVFDISYLNKVYNHCLQIGCVNAFEEPDKEESSERI